MSDSGQAQIKVIAAGVGITIILFLLNPAIGGYFRAVKQTSSGTTETLAGLLASFFIYNLNLLAMWAIIFFIFSGINAAVKNRQGNGQG